MSPTPTSLPPYAWLLSFPTVLMMRVDSKQVSHASAARGGAEAGLGSRSAVAQIKEVKGSASTKQVCYPDTSCHSGSQPLPVGSFTQTPHSSTVRPGSGAGKRVKQEELTPWENTSSLTSSAPGLAQPRTAQDRGTGCVSALRSLVLFSKRLCVEGGLKGPSSLHRSQSLPVSELGQNPGSQA